jgi:hypothetical protein
MASSLLQSPPLSPVSSSSSPAYSPIKHDSSRLFIVPDFHVPQHTHHVYQRSPRKSTSGRLSRPRAESGASIASHSNPKLFQKQWPFTDLHVHVVQRDITLSGYRLYAVEKWQVRHSFQPTCHSQTVAITYRLVQRFKICVLIVYTGDPSDKVSSRLYLLQSYCSLGL